MNKKNIKKIIKVLISMLILGIATVWVVHWKENAKGETMVRNFAPIDFPKTGNEAYYDFYVENNIQTEQLVKVIDDKKLDTVYVVSTNVDENVISNICKSLEVRESIEKRNDSFVTYGTLDNTLTIFSDGKIYYEQSDISKLNEEYILSDEKCIKVAEKFIKENDLEKYNLKLFSIDRTFSNDLDKPDEKIVVEKLLVYTRCIGEEHIYGESQLILSVSNTGKVNKMYMCINEIEEECSIKNQKQVLEAIEKIKDYEGFISVPEQSKKVVIDNVEIKYWEDTNSDNTEATIQPVYEFTGKSYGEDEKYLGEVKIVESVIE